MTTIRISDVILCRDIVIYNKEWNTELGEFITNETTLDLFLNNNSVAKLVYEK